MAFCQHPQGVTPTGFTAENRESLRRAPRRFAKNAGSHGVLQLCGPAGAFYTDRKIERDALPR
jgi:hypothetical protein